VTNIHVLEERRSKRRERSRRENRRLALIFGSPTAVGVYAGIICDERQRHHLHFGLIWGGLFALVTGLFVAVVVYITAHYSRRP
jgi:hypothetical protein